MSLPVDGDISDNGSLSLPVPIAAQERNLNVRPKFDDFSSSDELPAAMNASDSGTRDLPKMRYNFRPPKADVISVVDHPWFRNGCGVIVTTEAKEDFNEAGAKTLNQYVYVSSLGQGALAEVWKVQNMDTKECFALKEQSKSYLFKQKQYHSILEDMLECVREELSIMCDLDVPEVLKIIEIIDDETKDEVYAVMELMGGELLTFDYDQRVYRPWKGFEQKHLTADYNLLKPELAMRYFQQLCVGLHLLHSRKTCHRDLKPENILVSEDWEMIKLADFGTAYQFHKNDFMVDDPTGTKCYMSPAGIMNRDRDVFTDDVWALGVVLYVLLCGRPPFYDENEERLGEIIVKADIVFPENVQVKDSHQELINWLLNPDEKTRPTMEDVMKRCEYEPRKFVTPVKEEENKEENKDQLAEDDVKNEEENKDQLAEDDIKNDVALELETREASLSLGEDNLKKPETETVE